MIHPGSWNAAFLQPPDVGTSALANELPSLLPGLEFRVVRFRASATKLLVMIFCDSSSKKIAIATVMI